MALERTSGRVIAALGATGFLAAPGCSDDKPELAYVGNHVVVLSRDLVPCGGQVARYDRFIEAAFSVLGERVPPDFVATVHMMNEERFSTLAPCADYTAGCIEDGDAWIRNPKDAQHELAHLVSLAADGESLPYLEEGFAELLGLGHWDSTVRSPVLPPTTLLTVPRPDLGSSGYLDGAVFARFLVDRYGMEAFRGFFRAVARDSDVGEAQVAFDSVFGVSLESVEAEFLMAEESHCLYQLSDCDAPGLVTLRPGVAETVDLSCEDETALGYAFLDGEDYLRAPFQHRRVVFEGPNPGTLTVDDGLVTFVEICGTCSERFERKTGITMPVLQLDPGVWSLRFTLGDAAPTPSMPLTVTADR